MLVGRRRQLQSVLAAAAVAHSARGDDDDDDDDSRRHHIGRRRTPSGRQLSTRSQARLDAGDVVDTPLSCPTPTSAADRWCPAAVAASHHLSAALDNTTTQGC